MLRDKYAERTGVGSALADININIYILQIIHESKCILQLCYVNYLFDFLLEGAHFVGVVKRDARKLLELTIDFKGGVFDILFFWIQDLMIFSVIIFSAVSVDMAGLVVLMVNQFRL